MYYLDNVTFLASEIVVDVVLLMCVKMRAFSVFPLSVLIQGGQLKVLLLTSCMSGSGLIA